MASCSTLTTGRLRCFSCSEGLDPVLWDVIFSSPEPHIELEPKGFGLLRVRLVDKYRHLGNIIHANGHLLSELRVRVGAANTAFAQHRRAVYHNKDLGADKRLQIFNACVASILYWNCSTWPPLRDCEQRYFYGATKRLFRRFLLVDHSMEDMLAWTDQRLFAEAGVVDPSTHIRLSRLGYFGNLIRYGPAPLWALLATDETWLHMIHVDMPWLIANCQSRVFRPPFEHEQGPPFWETLILEQPGTWKGLIKKARAHALQQSQLHSQADRFERNLAALLQEYHSSLRPTPQTHDLEASDTKAPVICIPCQRLFETTAAWAVHCFKKHGRKAAERYIADQTACDACHHTFLNAHRLHLHLRHSRKCFDILRARGVYIEPLPGKGSKSWNAEAQFTQCPYLSGQGPDRDPNSPPDFFDLSMAAHENDLLVLLTNLETLTLEPYLQPETDDRMWNSIKDCLCATAVSFQEMRNVLLVWRTLIEKQPMTGRRLVPLVSKLWIRSVDVALQRLSYDWLCPDLAARLHAPHLSRNGSQRLHDIDLAACSQAPAPCYGPATTQPVFLHFFSGRRREGDLQQALESLPWTDAWDPIVVSLDVVLDTQFGDLLSPRVQRFWMDLILRGMIDGILMGPPCETWSIARERWKLDHQGPRPIRSRTELWGLSSLFLKELRQILVGNGLLQYCTLAHFAQWRQGRCSIMEHPAEPEAQDAPSIWRLRALQLLMALPHCHRERVHQGYFGAKSPKPTDLLCSFCPSPMADFARPWQTRKTLPAPLTMGRQCQADGPGQWNTFSLKEYPPQFNMVLARAFHHWWSSQPELRPLSLSPDELHIIKKFHQTVVGQGSIGPDYAFN